ncbi:MAG: hypothetical protein N3E49_05555 [Bacteroidia bacterium]|nr:hypothetical protein [Bacteroidia bacterium]
MVRKLSRFLSIVTHPVIVEASWIVYWSRWQIGWMLASFGILVGISGLLYAWVQAKERDILVLLGSGRRFLLLWHLIAIGGMWSAVTEPILYLWLSFFFWMSFWGFVLHWWREYSFHVYGWGGLCGFYLGYGLDYPEYAGLLALAMGAVAYLRYREGAHSIQEIGRGAGLGVIGGLGYVGFHTLMR